MSALVKVKVINLNDHDPVFTQKSYNVSIDENSSNGTVLLQVKAVDKDAGSYGEVMYELTGEHSENFHINPETGEISVANSNFLDHEIITECVLQVVGMLCLLVLPIFFFYWEILQLATMLQPILEDPCLFLCMLQSTI